MTKTIGQVWALMVLLSLTGCSTPEQDFRGYQGETYWEQSNPVDWSLQLGTRLLSDR